MRPACLSAFGELPQGCNACRYSHRGQQPQMCETVFRLRPSLPPQKSQTKQRAYTMCWKLRPHETALSRGHPISSNTRGHAVAAPRHELFNAVVFVDAKGFQFAAHSRLDGLGGAAGNRYFDNAVVITNAAGLIGFAGYEFHDLLSQVAP